MMVSMDREKGSTLFGRRWRGSGHSDSAADIVNCALRSGFLLI
jgi:hypothetical protein